MLRSGEVFFASHAELNDAQECRPRFVLRGSTELWSRLARLILENVCLQAPNEHVRLSAHTQQLLNLSKPIGSLLKRKANNRDVGIEELNDLFTEALRFTLSDSRPTGTENHFLVPLCEAVIRQTIPRLLDEPAYITSFSRNPTNPTMWGHYAGAEGGFVIIYESTDRKIGVHSPIPILHGVRPSRKSSFANYEIGIYREDRLQLTPVRYGKRPPKVNAFNRLIPKFSYSEPEDHYDVPLLLEGDAEQKQEQQVGLIKYSDWRYEREVRAFLPSFGAIPPDARVLRVSPQDITGLIFGPRMSDQDKARAILCCHLMRESLAHFSAPALPPFVFLQAKQTVDRFALDIHPFGLLDGMFSDHRLPVKKMSQMDAATKDRLQRMCAEIKENSDARTIAEESTD